MKYILIHYNLTYDTPTSVINYNNNAFKLINKVKLSFNFGVDLFSLPS